MITLLMEKYNVDCILKPVNAEKGDSGHHTDYEVGNVGPVMDGELNGFTKAYLMSEKEPEAS